MNSALRRILAASLRLALSWQRLRSRHQRTLYWAGVDLQDKHLRVVVLAAASAGKPVRVLECATRELNDELTAETLTDIAQSLVSRPQRWSLLLSRDDYRLSVIPAPNVPAEELTDSVRWQLAPVLDFPVEDAAIDVMAIPDTPQEDGRASELYAIAARGEVVAARAAPFREARLPLAAIDIHETAQRNMAALAEQSDELLVMVAFTGHAVQITFSWQGELYLDRLIAEQRNDSDSPARRAMQCERIAVQVQRSLDTVRINHPFMQAARIIAAGAPEGFVDAMTALVAFPVDLLRPEALLDLGAAPELRDPENFMRYFQAIGTALRGFAPQERAT